MTVTWTYSGGGTIMGDTLLDPPPGPFFSVVSPDMLTGTFLYSFQDSIPGTPGGNTGGGTFTVTAVPEPSSIALVVLGGPLALYLARRSRRGAARA